MISIHTNTCPACQTPVAHDELCFHCNKIIKHFGKDPRVYDNIRDFILTPMMSDEPTPKEKKWMEVCESSSKIFSTCTKAQYFSVLLDKDGYLIGQGYNGTISGAIHCVDGGCQRPIDKSASGSSYTNCSSAHAEQNAIIRSDHKSRSGSTIVVNGTPCYDCARLAAHAGVKRFVYKRDSKYKPIYVERYLRSFGVVTVAVG